MSSTPRWSKMFAAGKQSPKAFSTVISADNTPSHDNRTNTRPIQKIGFIFPSETKAESFPHPKLPLIENKKEENRATCVRKNLLQNSNFSDLVVKVTNPSLEESPIQLDQPRKKPSPPPSKNTLSPKINLTPQKRSKNICSIEDLSAKGFQDGPETGPSSNKSFSALFKAHKESTDTSPSIFSPSPTQDLTNFGKTSTENIFTPNSENQFTEKFTRNPLSQKKLLPIIYPKQLGKDTQDAITKLSDSQELKKDALFIQRPQEQKIQFQGRKPNSKFMSNFFDSQETEKEEASPVTGVNTITLSWEKLAQNSQAPNIGAGAIALSADNSIFIFGGDNPTGRPIMSVYKPHKDKWKNPECVGDLPKDHRIGTTGVAFRNMLIYFGGELVSSKTGHESTTTNEVLIYYAHKKTWRRLGGSTNMKGKSIITPRKYHTACKYEHLMVVYGGIDDEKSYCNDFWVFDTNTLTWRNIPIQEKIFPEPGIAEHGMCSVFQDKAMLNKDTNINKYMDGFYLFGGRTQNGEILNKLKVLNFNYESEGLSWKTCSVLGRAPQPRYGHSMTYHQNEKMIIIAGGFLKAPQGTVKAYDQQDFKILSLERLEWLNVRYENNLWTSRFGHTAAMFESKTLFVFGGRTDIHVCPNFGMQKININLEKKELPQPQYREITKTTKMQERGKSISFKIISSSNKSLFSAKEF